MTPVQQRTRAICDSYVTKFVNTRWHLEDQDKRGLTYQHMRHWTSETYRQFYNPSDLEWRFISRELIATVQEVVSEIVNESGPASF